MQTKHLLSALAVAGLTAPAMGQIVTDGTLDAARSEYQSLLRIMSAHPTVLNSDEEHTKLFGHFLSSYRGLDKSQDRGAAAWGFVLPLGDYFERLLLCTQNLACSATIYCAMVEPELVSFARVTEEFRKSLPDQEKPFAASLDQARKRVRCG